MYRISKIFILHKTIKWILLCFLISICATNYGQLIPENYNDDFVFKSSQLKSAANVTYNSEFGGVFTPRSELKILIIFCKFKNNSTDPNNSSWPSNQAVPNWILDDSFIFDSISDFNSISTTNRSISRYYWEMTKHLPTNQRFKFYGGYLSVEIEPAGARSWHDLTIKAYEEIKKKYSNLNIIFSQYDKRTGVPLYQTDNSINPTPDSIIDYAVIDFRFSSHWDDSSVPVAGMKSWTGSSGGYSIISGYDFGDYSISTGFTACSGMGAGVKLYTHEIGHELYEAPHYGNCNAVIGSYLTSDSFWGMMPMIGNEIYSGANAWERWFLGWISIKNDLIDKTNNGDYILRDYFTTGDAIRIKLPYVNNQYIWLENHQGTNIFEKRMGYDASLCGFNLPNPPTGLMVYGENISGSKSNVWVITSGANGMKLFNKQGNFDFSVIKYENRWEWCNNLIPNFKKGLPNPYSGYSTASRFLSDKNGDNSIAYTTNYNSGPREQDAFIWVDGNFEYGNFAPNSGFQVNDKLGMATNPAIVNFQTYNTSTKKLSPIYLNGISLQVLSKNANGDLTIRVKYDDFNYNDDTRMCGEIILPPETININANVDIQVDKSGTPNRTTKRNDVFINPSIVSTTTNTNLKLFNNASIVLENESAFILEENSTIELNENSRFVVKSGCTFRAKSGSNIIVKGSGKIVIENGAYFCIESGTNINLQDYLSVLNFHTGASMGVNTSVLTDPSICYTSLGSIAYVGNGSINQYQNDVYIQNETITRNRYISGRNIYVGRAVTSAKTQGDVVIKNGYMVIFDSEVETLIDKGFEAETGAGFEVIK